MADFARGGRRRYVLLVMVLLSVTLATLNSRTGDSGPVGTAGRLAHRVVQPLSNAVSTVLSPFHDWWHGVTHRGDLVAQNRKLKQELASAQAKARDGEQARLQNIRLRALVKFPWQNDYRNVDARIARQQVANYSHAVTLNVGSERGVKPNMAVVGPLGLVGRIVSVWQGGSTVLLATDPLFGVIVRPLLSTQTAPAQHAPDGRISAKFEDDSRHSQSVVKIGPGDTLYTCGCDNSALPLGLPVGLVQQAVRASDRNNVEVVVQSYVDLASLEFVKVLLWQPGDPYPGEIKSSMTPPTTTTTLAKPAATTTTTTKKSGP